jgi:type IV pilus assembly protein PilB
MSAVRPAELARARGLAERSGLVWLDLDGVTIAPAAIGAFPFALLAEAEAVPYAIEDGVLKVALADPAGRRVIESAGPRAIEFVVASRAAVTNVLGSLAQVRRRTGSLLPVESSADESAAGGETSMVYRAAEAGTTDLHYVPTEGGLSIRARIDGVLRQIGQVSSAEAQATISRLKVQAKLDISEQRRSQEGRLSLAGSSGRLFDVRITTLPTVAGEGAALRILERTGRPPTLTEIGLSDELQLALERVLNSRRGALLVTGPTGSGKSTTIYAALGDLARPELNVVSVEDPVEYRLDGIYQIEVNPHADVTFESALRSILRSDPDVVAVGEMRDLLTASTTLKAALTGSFVLSTLHTRDAPSAVTRLLDMGVEPYLTAAALGAVVAQRLVRRLCIHCRERVRPSLAEGAELRVPAGEFLFRAVGCEECDRGYRGQIGVHQLMLVEDELRDLMLAQAPYEAVAQAAVAGGMRTLWDDGLQKAMAGLTSVEELRRALTDLA